MGPALQRVPRSVDGRIGLVRRTYGVVETNDISLEYASLMPV